VSRQEPQIRRDDGSRDGDTENPPLDEISILTNYLGLSEAEQASFRVVCDYRQSEPRKELKKVVRSIIRDSEHLFSKLPVQTTRYDKRRPLADPSKDRSAEVNRARILIKVNVEKLALEAIDERAKSKGTDRSSFVTSLIETEVIEPTGTSKRLPKGARKATGVRVEPRVRKIVQERAKQAGMKPGAWVGRLMEEYVAKSREKEPI